MSFSCRGGLKSPGLLCLAASFSLLACAGDDADVRIFATFATFDSRERVEEVQLAVVDSCDEIFGDMPQVYCYAAATLRDDFEQVVRLENVPEGTYGVFGRGIDGAGCAIVAGCKSVVVRSGESPRVALSLEPVELGCDPPDVCGGPPL